MSNTKLASWFMVNMPASFWEKQGRKKALRTFHEAAEKVPAYKEFLREKKVKPEEIKTFEDFQEKVPITTKENYFSRNKIEDLVLGKLIEMYTIAGTSGLTGNPSYWPRDIEKDKAIPMHMELFFKQFWKIDKKSTLVIIALALGTWVAGFIMSSALREIGAKKIYPLTVITPGTNLKEIVEIIKNLSSKYDQTVILLYPPFAKNIIDEGEKQGINWKELNVYFFPGGERFGEEFREYLSKKLATRGKEDLARVMGVFAASDIGLVGFETPLTILIRKLALKDQALTSDLFGETLMPSLVQYNPAGFFIEGKNRELLFTSTSQAISIIKYRVGDLGGTISFNKVLGICQKHGYNIFKLLEKNGYTKKDIWTLPLCFIFGRKDAVSIDGANIYKENIEAVLYRRELKRIDSYKLAIETDKNQNMRFTILVGLKKGRKPSKRELANLQQKYHDIFLDKLLKTNDDFRDAFEDDPKSADPSIKIFPFGEGPFILDKTKIKRKYVL